MGSSLTRTVRDRLTVRHLLPMVAFLALFYGFTRSLETTAAIAFSMVLVESIDVLREAPGVDDRWVGVGIGTFVTVVSLAWLFFELTDPTETGWRQWFPALTALVGLWFLLDARRDFAEGRKRRPERDELNASETMRVMNHAHLVVEELRERPKTVPELADACDLTESRVREALKIASDDDMVYRVDDAERDDSERYALDESKVGGVAFVRFNVRRVLRRLARPLRY